MARSTNNAYLVNVRGKFGDTVVYKQINGKTYMTKAHSRHRTQSALQKENRRRFKEASSYALEQLKDPVKVEYYQRVAIELKLTNVYTAVLTEHLRKIRHLMKRPGGKA